MKKIFKKAVQLATALSIAASILPVGMMTASAATENVVEHNWILNADGTLRDGVSITAHYTKYYSDSTTAEGVIDGDEDLTKVLTRTDINEVTEGWSTGWLSGTEGAGTDSERTWSARSSYYLLVDLGAQRNINEIGYSPFSNAGSPWYHGGRIWLSNDPTFPDTDTCEVTNGNHVFTPHVLDTFTYSAEETKSYRYIKIKNYYTDGSDVACLGAKMITVKGTEVLEAEDLLHDSEGNLTAKLSSSHPGFPDIAKLQDINSIADGKYEIVRDEEGALDFEKATSFVAEFANGNGKWVQADLGETKAISQVRVLLYPGTNSNEASDYFRRNVSIIASNDPSFASPVTLASTGSTALEPGAWLEYSDAELSRKYRYIRVLGADNVIGVTELQVYGYPLCDAYLVYTNIDKYLITEENASPKRISNVSNLSKSNYFTWQDYNSDLVGDPVNDRLQLVFSGNLDPSTVNKDTLKITNVNNVDTKTLNYTPVVNGNVIYIDLCDFESFANVTVEITDSIKVNNMSVEPQTLNFKTQHIAPVPYVDGKVIKNVALLKKVMTSTTDKTAILNYQSGNSYLTDNRSDNYENEQTFVIDLGNEYDIVAYGMSAGSWAWHPALYDVYMSTSWADLQKEENKVYASNASGYGGRRHPNKKLDAATKARYITLYWSSFGGEVVNEFLAYAYMPAEPETGVADAYYDYNGTKPMFVAEKSDSSAAAKVLVARYNADGRLVDVAMTDESSLAFDASVTNEDETVTNYTVKAFVLGDLKNLQPLTSSVVY